MTTRAAPRPPGVPSPSKTPKAAWPDIEKSQVAFRFHALGASEIAADAYLDHLAEIGVRRLRAYVDRISDVDLAACLLRAEREAREMDTRGYGPPGRWYLTTRSKVRWPWRTST